MVSHFTGYGRRSQATPQTEPIPGSGQVLNNAGGYSWEIDDMARFTRFLILSTSGGTYYVGERKLTRDNLTCLERLMQAGRGKACVDLIVEISQAGRAASNDPALFALARLCASDVYGKITQPVPAEKTYELHREHHEALFARFPQEDVPQVRKDGCETWVRRGDILYKTVRRAVATVQIDHPFDVAVRQYAYAALPKVARTGTHFLHFLEYVKQFRGRGAAHRRAVKSWYNDRPADKLAYQLVKYQSRDGWSQRDVLRLAHPKPVDGSHNALYHWTVKGGFSDPDYAAVYFRDLDLLYAFEQVKKAETDREVADLIKQFRLPREAVPTQFLTSVRVWEALLETDMPLEAMVRNLATMTRHGVLEPMGSFTRSVATRLKDQQALLAARLHPVKILAALTTYQSGKSARGSSTWTPLPEIVDALDAAFYLSFGALAPSGKRLVLALDVSGSMGSSQINGIPGLTARVGSAAMALVTAASEQHATIMAFSRGFVPLSISPNQRLDDVVRSISHLPFDGTDCALPMLWAMQHHVQADAFVIYTDSETWAGQIHPVQALRMYRQQTGIPAKLIVVGMTSTGFTIADPADSGCLDVVGFDTATPELLSGFIRGDFSVSGSLAG